MAYEDLSKYYKALEKADAAGNYDDAKQIAAYIKSIQSTSGETETPTAPAQRKKIDGVASEVGKTLVSAADTGLNLLTGVAGITAYPTARLLGQSPERSHEIASSISGFAANPIGRVLGITEDKAYSNPVGRTLEAIGSGIDKYVTQPIASATGINPYDVQSGIDIASLIAGPKAAKVTGKAVAPIVDRATTAVKSAGDTVSSAIKSVPEGIQGGIKAAKTGEKTFSEKINAANPEIDPEIIISNAEKAGALTPSQANAIRLSDYEMPKNNKKFAAFVEDVVSGYGKANTLPGALQVGADVAGMMGIGLPFQGSVVRGLVAPTTKMYSNKDLTQFSKTSESGQPVSGITTPEGKSFGVVGSEPQTRTINELMAAMQPFASSVETSLPKGYKPQPIPKEPKEPKLKKGESIDMETGEIIKKQPEPIPPPEQFIERAQKEFPQSSPDDINKIAVHSLANEIIKEQKGKGLVVTKDVAIKQATRLVNDAEAAIKKQKRIEWENSPEGKARLAEVEAQKKAEADKKIAEQEAQRKRKEEYEKQQAERNNGKPKEDILALIRARQNNPKPIAPTIETTIQQPKSTTPKAPAFSSKMTKMQEQLKQNPVEDTPMTAKEIADMEKEHKQIMSKGEGSLKEVVARRIENGTDAEITAYHDTIPLTDYSGSKSVKKKAKELANKLALDEVESIPNYTPEQVINEYYRQVFKK